MHSFIHIKGLGLAFPKTRCFEGFSAQIVPHSRIAIIGDNGAGKSSLLNILRGTLSPTEGCFELPPDVRLGYVPQIIEETPALSGGQRFNQYLSQVLATCPNVLLLDEPTNHLDQDNRTSLMRMLTAFHGTVIVISHDETLLNTCIDTLWHIEGQQVHQFSGRYDVYMHARQQRVSTLERELSSLKRDKRRMHEALMREQKRAASSRTKGKKSINNKKWPTVVSHAKAHRAGSTAGKKQAAIDQSKQRLNEKLESIQLPERIVPHFSLMCERYGHGGVLSIAQATVGYVDCPPVLTDVHLAIGATERIVIQGKNASGKSTLLKGILGTKGMCKSGIWDVPKAEHIGYLDQHYANLTACLSVFEQLKCIKPEWSDAEIRKHLNAFLFRGNDIVFRCVSTLSGGERVRLSLAVIAAQVPRLLILDEITNNLDLTTKAHVTDVLAAYPGSLIVVSHDEAFVEAICPDQYYEISAGTLKAMR